jgi:hypothetical protein
MCLSFPYEPPPPLIQTTRMLDQLLRKHRLPNVSVAKLIGCATQRIRGSIKLPCPAAT